VTFALRPNQTSWGRVVRTSQRVAAPRFADELPRLLAAGCDGGLLPVGMRRSYGDTVINDRGAVIDMTGLDRFVAVDRERRLLRAEAGITLDAILHRTVPMGLFLPVTPGTRFATLGGAIANDVHGKNHHRAGTIGRHVRRLSLLRSDGSHSEIGPDSNPELFAATVAGLGLTGVIEWAEIELQKIDSTYLDVENIPFRDLAEFWDLSNRSAATHSETVAWIDCFGAAQAPVRGIFSRANRRVDGRLDLHAPKPKLSVPIDMPNWVLTSLSMGLFNDLYNVVRSHGPRAQCVHYAAFDYPLDGIGDWNRMYGKRGFWQYQLVVPTATMKQALPEILREIRLTRQGSFLAVLKTFGGLSSPGLMSFPLEGATLALDFPNRGQPTIDLFARLDAIVRNAGGRLYAAKDGRIPAAMWRATYPNLDRFRFSIDPALTSNFWRRVSQ
jgi:FAD/FMN-containing dehydrogenase